MDDRRLEYASGAVRPFACLSAGWNLIKDQYWLVFGITLVGILIGSLAPFGILLGPCMCGIFLCLIRKERGQPFTFEMLFKGFDYFVQSLIATLFVMIPIFVLAVPAYLIFVFSIVVTVPEGPDHHGDVAPLIPLAIGIGLVLAFLAIVILLQIAFFFIYPLIVDHGFTGLEAVKNSFRAGFANFGGLLGLTLLNMLLSLVGVMCCYVGVFFVAPITVAAQLKAYRQVFPEGTALRDTSRQPY